VKRGAFVAGAAAVSIPLPAPAANLHHVIDSIAATSSGIVGAYARRLGARTPLLAYNADIQFPAASVIKVLILVSLYQAAQRDPQLFTRRVRLRAEDMVGVTHFLSEARPGATYSVRYLAKAMIVASDNTAANTLITLLGFTRINATAYRAGLRHTQLKRHFLDYSAIVRHSENLTTPRDMGELLYAVELGSHEALRTVASPHSCRAMINLMLQLEDRDKIARGLPRGTPLANKTGEVDFVRNDVAVVDPFGDEPYVLTVFTKRLWDYGRGLDAIRRVSKAVHGVIARGMDDC
jgi:beta-lactamase class A